MLETAPPARRSASHQAEYRHESPRICAGRIAAACSSDSRALPAVRIDGLSMHFANSDRADADEGPVAMTDQLERFEAAVVACEVRGASRTRRRCSCIRRSQKRGCARASRSTAQRRTAERHGHRSSVCGRP